MDACYIDYDATHSFSDALNRYIRRDGKLKPFYAYYPDQDGFSGLLKSKKNNPDRSVLTEVLREQYATLPALSSSVKENIRLLESKDTFTVTTGHQLNIFTGPLYFIFKIVSAINLAKELKEKFPDKNFVPVYWMASEDHDFAEINHTYLFGQKIVWNAEVNGATGRIDPQSIQQALKQYRSALGISPNAKKLDEIISYAYTAFPTLAQSTRYLVDALFGEYGLVILDADDKQLKSQFAAITFQDISQQNSFRNINDSNRKLADLGVEAQVNPREINFFYLKDGLRERLIYENERYLVNQTTISFSEDELRQEVESYPERFSPNVVMRPLYQEVILPNIAYIGGGAEMIYWLQLKSNFDFYGIDFPILLLRNSAMIVDETVGQKLQKLGLRYEDVFKEFNQMAAEWVAKHTEHTLNIDAEKESISLLFQNLKSRIAAIDQTLGPSTEAVSVRLQKALLNLEKKILKAEKRNHQESLRALQSVKDRLFPSGILQERRENFAQFYLKYGDDFIASLMRNFKPLDLKFTIITNGVSSDC